MAAAASLVAKPHRARQGYADYLVVGGNRADEAATGDGVAKLVALVFYHKSMYNDVGCNLFSN